MTNEISFETILCPIASRLRGGRSRRRHSDDASIEQNSMHKHRLHGLLAIVSPTMWLEEAFYNDVSLGEH